jgi:radical SAM-linked protein
MQRAFGRALRRADIDVEYSKGFNPHIIMSFASPLSVGYATEADYLELSVNSGERGI